MNDTPDLAGLYDTDILEWSERQAALLRRRAAGELVNEADLDWPHIAEEIASVGQSQVDTVESLLFQALLCDLKAEAWPLARDVPAWRGDARGFRAQARRKYRPSMRQKLDILGLYADALQGVPDTVDEQAPLPVPPNCPVTLDECWPSRERRIAREAGRAGEPAENAREIARAAKWLAHSYAEAGMTRQADNMLRE